MTETKGRYIRGGNGSHWEGCEETHWDCRIARLEQENSELRSEIARLNKIIDLQSQMLKAWENTKCT